jgi:hypothetical protein
MKRLAKILTGFLSSALSVFVLAILAFSAAPGMAMLAFNGVYTTPGAGIQLVSGPCQSQYPSGANQFNSAPAQVLTYGQMNSNGIPDGNNPWQTGNAPNKPDGVNNASALIIRLYKPSGGCVAGGCPIVAQFHGGVGEVYGDFTQIEGPGGEAGRLSFPSQLTGNGYAVAVVWYPLAPGWNPSVNVFPAQLQAAVCAIRYLKANASTLGLNGDKIVTWDESAGNWYGSMLATNGVSAVGAMPDPGVGALPIIMGVQQHYDNPGCLTPPTATNTKVLGSIANYGFYDAIAFCGTYSGYFGFSCPPSAGANSNTAKAASPFYQATSSTGGQVILRGANDTASTDAINVEWYNQTVALGIPSIYITIPNVGHGYHQMVDMNQQPPICTTLTYMQSILHP